MECFVGALRTGRTRYGSVQVSREWDHKSGFVDVLARDDSKAILAFEAKLSDWRRLRFVVPRCSANQDTLGLSPESLVGECSRET